MSAKETVSNVSSGQVVFQHVQDCDQILHESHMNVWLK